MPPRNARATMDVIYRPDFLTPAEQAAVVDCAFSISPGFYTPRTRWGKPMSVRMNCLGWHWSARDYKYHDARVDADGSPCAPVPQLLADLAERAVVETGYVSPADVRRFDICIVNFYPEATGKMGDHVDNSESPESIAGGYPVVSLSIGASCVFRIGGLARTDPYEEFTLASGDLILFGRSKRLAYHGVRKIVPGTTPDGLQLPEPGRINLTFRVR